MAIKTYAKALPKSLNKYLIALIALTLAFIYIPQVNSKAFANDDTEDNSTSNTQIQPFKSGVTRLSGDNRYDTAIAASKRFAPGVPVVFVSTGENFPDALGAAAAAAKLGGPLLLSPSNSLPNNVNTEIKRLKPEKIVIVGGTGAINKSVENQLLKTAPTTRLGGNDRYETGQKIVDYAFDTASTVFIATGRDFPDALAASGAAGKLESPIILVDGKSSSTSKEVITKMRNLGATDIFIVGGDGVVSKNIQKQLQNNNFNVNRLGGNDRYETASKINQAFFTSETTEVAFLATGLDFPDALAGAALAGQIEAPLFVTTKQCVPSIISDFITELDLTSTVIMGGTGVISKNAANNNPCLSVPVINKVAHPGAYCNGYANSYALTKTGLLMQCKTSSTDSSLRWRQA